LVVLPLLAAGDGEEVSRARARVEFSEQSLFIVELVTVHK